MAEIAAEVNNLRVPPQALDVEQAVLCAMMLDKEAIAKAIESIDETYFYTLKDFDFLASKLLIHEAERKRLLLYWLWLPWQKIHPATNVLLQLKYLGLFLTRYLLR